ncbi:hypothetical protein [Salinilacihabitans rarus]|uniref:hypothetical protein n=1 Tax=Salinilacihabitans rarus TaxID=2961596 RepID=UPI0020C8AAFC|nr:hypothetical protein [Salinilacihabitans rarus]
MALQLSRAIGDGIRRVPTRTGGVLFGLLLLTQLLTVASTNTLIEDALPAEAAPQVGLTLPLSGTAAAVLLGATYAFTGVYGVLVARGFARPLSALSTFPSELYTRHVGRATLRTLVGGVVVGVAVAVGTLVLVVPGLFLAVSFLFFIFAVGVEDRGVVGGLRRSWALARGNRLRLGLVVLFLAGTGMVAGIVPPLFAAAGAPSLGDLASVLLNSVLFVFVYGIMAAAYLQLRDGDASPSASSTVTVEPGD